MIRKERKKSLKMLTKTVLEQAAKKLEKVHPVQDVLTRKLVRVEKV
jgi:hypothetical protein